MEWKWDQSWRWTVIWVEQELVLKGIAWGRPAQTIASLLLFAVRSDASWPGEHWSRWYRLERVSWSLPSAGGCAQGAPSCWCARRLNSREKTQLFHFVGRWPCSDGALVGARCDCLILPKNLMALRLRKMGRQLRGGPMGISGLAYRGLELTRVKLNKRRSEIELAT